MPTFAAVLASFEWVIRSAIVHRLVGTAATRPFTEQWIVWDLNPKCSRDGSACLLLVREEVQDFPSPQDWDCADSFHVQEVLVAGDKSVDPRNKRRGG